MNTVLAHDYLIQMGGAERLVASMHRMFPQAPIYTSAVDRRGLAQDFKNADIRSSWMQKIPGVTHHTHFKKFFALYPLAFRSFRPVHANVLWISCSTFAKFLRPAPDTCSICYLHNTTRFLWQSHSYLGGELCGPLAKALLTVLAPPLRMLDRRTGRSRQTL
jgi:hypothetical protein